MKKLIVLLTPFILTSILSCEVWPEDTSKGKCVYGPEGISACVNTDEDDCINNFNGTWYEGEECTDADQQWKVVPKEIDIDSTMYD